MEPLYLNVNDEELKINFKGKCQEKGSNMTRVLNDFMRQYCKTDEMTIDDFNFSPRVFDSKEIWRKFYSTFVTLEEFRKIDLILQMVMGIHNDRLKELHL